MWVAIDKIDVYAGMRPDQRTMSVAQREEEEKERGPMKKFLEILF